MVLSNTKGYHNVERAQLQIEFLKWTFQISYNQFIHSRIDCTDTCKCTRINKWLAKIQRKSVSFFARLKNDIIYQYLQFWKPVDYLLDTEINSKFCMGSIFKLWQNNQWHIVSSKVIGRLAQLDVQFYWIQSFEIFD